MRIAQITPGNIPIPTDGWGAVEKVIWEYTKVLRDLGHDVEILYTDEVVKGEWDVVHVHMANLALVLKERGIPYVFSHHDHHAYHFGKNSDVYKQNMEAIEGSQLSFVHAKYIVEYFGSPKNLRYLEHGVNIKDYAFLDRSEKVNNGDFRLLMMANNGLGGNPMYDRKGFLPGINAARSLDLPITIICPSKGNKELLSSIEPYDKLKIIYDLPYEDVLEEMNKHEIFLNPSMLEAGHPNLTVTESIAKGVPVVGTCEEELPGTKKISLPESLMVDHTELADGIADVIKRYPSYVMECQEYRNLISWEVIVSRMLMEYTSYLGIDQGKILMDSYTSTKKIENNKSGNSGIYSWFKSVPFLHKSRITKPGTSVSFIDKLTGEIITKSEMPTDSRSWIYSKTDPNRYVDWEIVVKEGAKIIYRESMDIRNRHIVIKGANSSHKNLLEIFSKETGSIITLDTCISGFFYLGDKSEDFFYCQFNIGQIEDYYNEKIRIPERTLIKLTSGSLGDNIAFVPYANEYGLKHNIIVDVFCEFHYLFDGIYSNINFVNSTESAKYTNYISLEYLFDVPLQKGFSDQLLLEYREISPIIKKSYIKERKINGKYICFSMHSTAQAKHWNNNEAWFKLCEELRKNKLIPVCIDRYSSFGTPENWNPIPGNCVNMTGGDLDEMIAIIENCEFFIGLSSGLSWLAHGLGKKVVMISGVTSKDNEFTHNCIRIHREDVCNSCFNQPNKYTFDKGDWMWCPLYKGTAREFECTKKISAKQVIDRIKKEKLI